MLNSGEISSAINQAFANGHSLAIISVVNPISETPNQRLLIEENNGAVTGTLGFDQSLDAMVAEIANSLLADDRQEIVTQNIGEFRVLFEIARPPLELIVCGAGHVGQAVAQAGIFLGFQVTVIDDRADFASRARFPDERINVLAADFIPALQSIKITPASHVVVVTRGHKHDEICLREVLDKPAKYLGMIGSRRRTTTIREHLKREGFAAETLQGVHAPIGLDIGAQTPEEIALAILSEIIMIRRGGDGGSKSAFVRKNKN